MADFGRDMMAYLSRFQLSHFIILLCSLLSWGCVPHVQIRVPPKNTPLKKRIQAYESYRATTLATTTVVEVSSRGNSIKMRQQLDLNNGKIVYDPSDLLPAVEKDSTTAFAARRFQSNMRKRNILTYTGFGVIMAGLGVALFTPSIRLDDPSENKPPELLQLGLWIGSGVIVAGIVTGFVGYRVYGARAYAAQREAFFHYNQDLMKRLGLKPKTKKTSSYTSTVPSK